MIKPGSIVQSEAVVVSHRSHAGEQYVMRLDCPQIASLALPGQFMHIKCDPMLPMRRPFSIMRADPRNGCVDMLYKIVGEGTLRLRDKKPGDVLDALGPIGNGFDFSTIQNVILIGGGVGMPPVLFAAEYLKRHRPAVNILVLLGSEVGFPFKVEPSAFLVPHLPNDVMAASALLDALGIPSRLASSAGLPGIFEGYVTDLAAHYLSNLSGTLATQTILACGPEPMLKACANLAVRFGIDCQLCLEANMACAVGGCAGCIVPIYTEGQMAMKRVCVDGPVFSSNEVYI